MELVDERGAINDPFRNFIAVSRYARWVEDENRRETWSETVDRYTDFMADHMAKNYKYKMDKKEIRKAILNHEVMPSMRALMTAGPAAERDNMSLYNCSFIAVDSPRSFDEALYVLMNGTGVGFSVESEHVSKLPMVNEHFEDSETVIVVGDSKGGWARGLRELIAMLYVGQVPSWDTSGVRTAGARLKTFGGRASGPEPLEDLFRFVTDVFRGAAGRKLLPIEAHDIMCKIGECVVVGGVRRCFGDNAEIHTDRGVVLGKDISIDDMIISGGRKARVTAKIDSGRQLTVIVKHQYGQSEMTPNHRIAVFDGVDSYTFKEAGSLEPGDRLVWDLAGYDGEIQSLPKPSYLGHFNAKSFKIPDMLDTDVAWLIGLVHGDGHIHAKGIEISSNDGEWDTLERANIIFTKSFGVSGKVSRDSHDGHGIRLRINSTGLAMWFAENIKTPNVSIRIPEFIKFAQRDVRAAYLAGVLDSDGRIRPDGVIDQATTIYIDFSRDLSEILRSLGIPSKIKKSSAQRRRDNGVNAKDFWTTSVSTKTGHGLYFESAGKYSQKNILARVGNTGDFTYPAEFGLSYRARNTTRSWAIEKGLLDKDFPFAPVRVESVEIGTVQQTWDIEVEDIHEFTADGLVTHNSALISLSDSGDFDMAKAKSGKWWESQPHRRLSNNSAVYTSKPSVGKFLTEWSHLWESQSGERGIFNKEGNQHHASSNGRRDGSKISGTNPCLTGDTWVMTTHGPRQIIDIIEQKTDLMLDGKMYDSTGFFYTGTKPVYKVSLNNGMSLRATDNHRILTEDGWKELRDLTVCDKIRLSQNQGHSWGGNGTTDEGYLIGLLVGDGTFGANACIDVWESSDSIVAKAESAMIGAGINTMFNLCTQVGNEKKWRATSREITQLATRFGVVKGNKTVTKQIQEASSEFYEGFLRGYFDADGSPQGNRNKGLSVRLWSVQKDNLDGTQKMLSRLGITSKVYLERQPAGKRMMPDSNRELAMYDCRAGHELVISRHAIALFADRVGFGDINKSQRLNSMTVGTRELYKNSEFSQVMAIQADGVEDVYDATVPEVSAFDANGIYVHNCAEIILRSYQTCNLTEVVVRPDDTFATLTEKVRIAATMGTIQSSLVNFKYLRKIWKDNCEEERLLGVSLTGQMGHPVLNGSNGLDKTAKWLDKLREVAIDTNAEVADKMGINHSTAITTVKPSGTVSQLTQVSSGMHYWHSEYYIRTVRADNKDPLTAFLQDIGIPSEPDTMAPNTSTVFSFPIAAPANARSGRSVSAIEHLNIWKIYKKHWTEHNPSITVSVKDDEWVEVAAWVYDNWEDVGGLSFLPFSDHIYEQAPYQEITAEEYQELKSKMPVTIPWENLSLYELIDGTTGSQELACVANSCETVDITPVAF